MKLLEKFLYYSVGFAAQTEDKLTKLMQKLLEQNKVTKEEAKTFLDDYSDKIKELTKTFDKKLEDFISEDILEREFISSSKLKKTEERISKLEKLLDKKLKEKEKSKEKTKEKENK